MIWEKRNVSESIEETGDTNSHSFHLLLNPDIEANHKRNKEEEERCKTLYDRKLKTVLLYLGYFVLGACVSIVGPSLPDFQLQLGTSLETTTFIFTARSTGHLLGSIVGGACFDRLEHHFVLALSLLGAGICGLFIAWCDYFIFIVIVIAVWGFFTGSLETGVNVVCVDAWGKDSGPWIQGLHFFFSVGCTMAPLIATPFLTPPPPGAVNITTYMTTTQIITTPSMSQFERTLAMQTDSNSNSQQFWPLNGSKFEEFISPPQNVLEATPDFTNASKHYSASNERMDGSFAVNISEFGPTFTREPSRPTDDRISTNAEFYDNTTVAYNETIKVRGKLWIPYTIISIFEITLAAPFLCMFTRGSVGIVLPKAKSFDHVKQPMKRKKYAISRIILVILVFFFSFACIGVEIIYGGFIYTFAMKSHLHFSVKLAGYLNSAFWGSYAASLAVGICCALALTPRTMLIIDLTGLCAAGALLAVFGDDNMAVLWGTTVLLGVSLAKVFPTGIFWTETYIKLTGKAVATFITASAASEMILPWLCGNLITSYGNMMLMYITLALSLFTTVMFVCMQITASFHGERIRKSDKDEDGDTNSEIEQIKVIHFVTVL